MEEAYLSQVGRWRCCDDRIVGSNNIAGGNGGGIYAGYVNGVQVVSAMTISGNSAGGDGGGIWHGASDRGSFSLQSSTVSDNISGRNGGGAFGISTRNSTISGNTAFDRGGGLYMFREDIGFSTIVNNRAGAGPVSVASLDGGGGVWGPAGGTSYYSLTISSSIIAGNGLVGETGELIPDDFNGGADSSSTFHRWLPETH